MALFLLFYVNCGEKDTTMMVAHVLIEWTIRIAWLNEESHDNCWSTDDKIFKLFSEWKTPDG